MSRFPVWDRVAQGRNPFRVEAAPPVPTQGSSSLATLGFEAESLWDSLLFPCRPNDVCKVQRGCAHSAVVNLTKLAVTMVAVLPLATSSRAEEKITYDDQILRLVEANCSKCHNVDKKKADLDLTSYQGALKGSGSGPIVLSGNLDGSKLWKALM